MKKVQILVAFLNALCMSATISFVMITINVGWTPVFLVAWLRAWTIAFCVAFPLACFLPARIVKLANKILGVSPR